MANFLDTPYSFNLYQCPPLFEAPAWAPPDTFSVEDFADLDPGEAVVAQTMSELRQVASLFPREDYLREAAALGPQRPFGYAHLMPASPVPHYDPRIAVANLQDGDRIPLDRRLHGVVRDVFEDALVVETHDYGAEAEIIFHPGTPEWGQLLTGLQRTLSNAKPSPTAMLYSPRSPQGGRSDDVVFAARRDVLFEHYLLCLEALVERGWIVPAHVFDPYVHALSQPLGRREYGHLELRSVANRSYVPLFADVEHGPAGAPALTLTDAVHVAIGREDARWINGDIIGRLVRDSEGWRFKAHVARVTAEGEEVSSATVNPVALSPYVATYPALMEVPVTLTPSGITIDGEVRRIDAFGPFESARARGHDMTPIVPLLP